MGGQGQILNEGWRMVWNEEKNEISIWPPNTKLAPLHMTYSDARLVLDCFMFLFSRQELAYRYPEVR